MSAKALVKAFYDTDLANDTKVVSKFFHKECELHWTGSQGFMQLDYKGMKEFFEVTRLSYTSLRFEFTHFIEANEFVTTRHTLYGCTIENSDSEIALGHFSSLWEVKDGKLYRGYEISQQVDESNAESMASYKQIKL
ncbi:MAG: nuclear transport factor 2 family protein [Winogradskyella sp.]|uniref:nuclear transport factor 2 family protein n=1 Tax=Winogradskyella sp. TaxID=1883156 RepID=UPI00385F2A9B